MISNTFVKNNTSSSVGKGSHVLDHHLLTNRIDLKDQRHHMDIVKTCMAKGPSRNSLSSVNFELPYRYPDGTGTSSFQ
jgi:hypothetical protein